MKKAVTNSDKAEETRSRILDAALGEFSRLGLAGARTDHIAKSAKVNKALLYYYFKSKDGLYTAVLEWIANKMYERSMETLLRKCSAGEKLLRSALEHFDRILAQLEFQALLQQEMMRLHRNEKGTVSIFAERVFAPIHKQIELTVREGVKSGELIDVDWLQITLMSLGANVFYFLSSPMWRLTLPFEPLAPKELAKRRKVMIETLGQAIFIDRKKGAVLAGRVLKDTPMPKISERWRRDERAK